MRKLSYKDRLEIYERYKHNLQYENLTPQEYEKALRKKAEQLKI